MHVSIQRVNMRSVGKYGGGGVRKKRHPQNTETKLHVRIGDIIIQFYNYNKTDANDNYMGHSPSGDHILSATQKVPIILQEGPTTALYR